MCFWANDAFSVKSSCLFAGESHQEPFCLHFQDRRLSNLLIAVAAFPSLCLSYNSWLFLSFEQSARLETLGKQGTEKQQANVKLCSSQEVWSDRAPNGNDLGFLHTEEPMQGVLKETYYQSVKHQNVPKSHLQTLLIWLHETEEHDEDRLSQFCLPFITTNRCPEHHHCPNYTAPTGAVHCCCIIFKTTG